MTEIQKNHNRIKEKEMITEYNGQLWRNGNKVYFSGQWIKVTNPPKEVQG